MSEYNPKEIALAAAKVGFLVFPTNPQDKKPYINAWQKNASRDPSQIIAWWQQWPKAMVAVVTGHASNLLLLDIDVAEGEDPNQKLTELENAIGLLPPTMTVRTPSGGLHLYYQMPEEDIRNSAGKLGQGIDIRGNGGYVIFAGSKRADGKAYEIIERN